MSFKVLFVCMGNICRSPAGESVLNHLLLNHPLRHRVVCDSAGTTGYHSGASADRRMRKALESRGIEVAGTARQITAADLRDFDLILAMDQENLADIRALDPEQQYADKVQLFGAFCRLTPGEDVPDPYYGAECGFDQVMDMLLDGGTELVKYLEQQLK